MYIPFYVLLAWLVILIIDCFWKGTLSGNEWVVLISGILFLLNFLYMVIFLPGMWKVTSLLFLFTGSLFTFFGAYATKK